MPGTFLRSFPKALHLKQCCVSPDPYLRLILLEEIRETNELHESRPFLFRRLLFYSGEQTKRGLLLSVCLTLVLDLHTHNIANKSALVVKIPVV